MSETKVTQEWPLYSRPGYLVALQKDARGIWVRFKTPTGESLTFVSGRTELFSEVADAMWEFITDTADHDL